MHPTNNVSLSFNTLPLPTQNTAGNGLVSEKEKTTSQVAQVILPGVSSSQVSTTTTSNTVVNVSSDNEGGGTADYQRSPRDACTPGCGYTWSDLGCGY